MKGVCYEQKKCLGPRPDTVTKGITGGGWGYPQGVTDLETTVVKLLSTRLMVPLSVSIGKEFFILVVSVGVGGMSMDH